MHYWSHIVDLLCFCSPKKRAFSLKFPIRHFTGRNNICFLCLSNKLKKERKIYSSDIKSCELESSAKLWTYFVFDHKKKVAAQSLCTQMWEIIFPCVDEHFFFVGRKTENWESMLRLTCAVRPHKNDDGKKKKFSRL